MRVHGYGGTGLVPTLIGIVLTVVFAFGGVGAWVAGRRRWAIGLAIGVAAAILLLAGLVLAQTGRHGDGHAEHHDWYQRHKQPGTSASCCGARRVKPDGNVEGDCRPVRAFRTDDGFWHAVVDGRPIKMPRHVILQEAAPDGRAHLCMSESGTPLCFFEPQPKS